MEWKGTASEIRRRFCETPGELTHAVPSSRYAPGPHVVVVVLLNIASKSQGAEIQWTNRWRCRSPISIHSVNLRDYYTVPYQLLHQNRAEWSNGELRPLGYQPLGKSRVHLRRSFLE